MHPHHSLTQNYNTMNLVFVFLVVVIFFFNNPCSGGTWSLLNPNIGISAMHMQLLPNDRVLIYDRTSFGTSNVSLPLEKCPPNSTDCSAHSVEYEVGTNTIRPLVVLTDFWCSSGSLMPDGTVVQTGGNGDGELVVRTYKSCDTCDWEEIPSGLVEKRWYATNVKLPDGRQIIIGGRGVTSYEFFPKTSEPKGAVDFPFLRETRDPTENNLYPFVFLCPDGNLFVFANNRAILINYANNQVLKTFPEMPPGEPRNYPSTGSAVLLPLRIVNGNVEQVEVMVCGGAPRVAYPDSINKIYDEALNSCGRLKITDSDPQWEMEIMPVARLMGDMILLPSTEVLLINGWEYGRDPVFTPLLYRGGNPAESRFELQTETSVPRMYHSTALLLRDGRVLVGGNKPHDKYEFSPDALFPTDLSLQVFSPSYLDSNNARPVIIQPLSGITTGYGEKLSIMFAISSTGQFNPSSMMVTMVSPSFVTHSFSMNQRLLILEGIIDPAAADNYNIHVTMPTSGNIAPPGYYLMYVVYMAIPSDGIWVQLM